MVNSIFFGSGKDNQKISGVEEASIFLGLNRIRELLAATPVIEEITNLGKNVSFFPWVNFWKHSIGTAILTREILSLAEKSYEDESDYVAGLLHNLGKLILAITFPELFKKLSKQNFSNHCHAIKIEKEIIGWDHAKIGAFYLWNHHISDQIVEAIHWHNQRENQTQTQNGIRRTGRRFTYLSTWRFRIEIGSREKLISAFKDGKSFGNREENETALLTEELNFVERVSKTLHGIV